MSGCNCGATWTGKRIEHCTVCHQTFSGTTSGDRHRVGTYQPDTRRCLTPTEMQAAGMGQNSRGVWVTNPGGWTNRHGNQHTTPDPTSPDLQKPARVHGMCLHCHSVEVELNNPTGARDLTDIGESSEYPTGYGCEVCS